VCGFVTRIQTLRLVTIGKFITVELKMLNFKQIVPDAPSESRGENHGSIQLRDICQYLFSTDATLSLSGVHVSRFSKPLRSVPTFLRCGALKLGTSGIQSEASLTL
jgi:hypothetical protein